MNYANLCPKCGTAQLEPNQKFCSNCGTVFNPVPQGYQPTQMAGSNPGFQAPPPTPGYQATQLASSTPNNYPPVQSNPSYSQTPSNPNYQQTPLGGGLNQPYPPAPAEQIPAYGNASYGNPPASTNYNVDPYGNNSTPSYPPAPPQQPMQSMPGIQPGGMYPQSYQQPKKGPNVGLIVTIIVLVVVVIGGGIWYATTLKSSPIGGTGGTPTVNSTPTTENTTKTLLTESFKDNSNNWDLVSTSSQTSTISGGVLTLTEKDKGYLTQEIPNSASWKDFQLSVSVTLKQGKDYDAGGIWFRGEETSDNSLLGYYVSIYGDGTFALEKYYTDTSANKNKLVELSESTSSNVKPVGQANKVRLIVKGTKIVAYMNDYYVGTFTDNEFSSGTLALVVGVGSTSTQAVATYSNLVISEAPATLPTK